MTCLALMTPTFAGVLAEVGYNCRRWAMRAYSRSVESLICSENIDVSRFRTAEVVSTFAENDPDDDLTMVRTVRVWRAHCAEPIKTTGGKYEAFQED